tara:strand:+ start:17 stop:454 length:438 start_codon:yes stop_codon:yes gene_type:complete
MLQPKKKKCNGCGETTVIWKSEGREKYCKQCWSCHKTSGVRQTSAKKRTALSPRSSKQTKKDALYAILRKAYLKDHQMCEAHLNGCATYATDIHHKAGRGVYYLDSTTYMAVCRSCHQWIETHPKEAKETGFSVERLKTNNQNED